MLTPSRRSIEFCENKPIRSTSAQIRSTSSRINFVSIRLLSSRPSSSNCAAPRIPESGFLTYLLTDLNLLTQTIISTLIILFTAEFLPKVFFQIYANSLLKILAFPAYLFYVFFTFISDFVIWISDVVLKKFFKTEGDQVQLAFTKVELGNYISEQMESVEEHEEIDTEIQIFQNALEFSEVKAREVMVPRTEITALELHDSVDDLSKLFTETGYSKILIYKETIDEILGYVHSFDLFKNIFR